MFRNRDGEPFTLEQYHYFNDTLTEDFKNNPEIKRYGLKEEDLEPISNFYFLLHMNIPEIKDNFIRKRFEQAQHLIYKIRKRDEDYKGKATLEKTVINITKKRFKNVAIGILDTEKYNSNKILQYIVYYLNGKNYPNLSTHFIANFIKKYKGIAQQTMADLRIRTHRFKNTGSAKVFQKQLSDLYPENTIDFDNLYKFLAVTGKLNSNKEDLTWLSELTQILVPTIYSNKKNINKEEDDLSEQEKLELEEIRLNSMQSFIDEA